MSGGSGCAATAHEADLDWLSGLLLGLLPGLHAEAWLTKPCLIPETPTKLPYVEIVEPGCVMAVGGNGYAAKSADARSGAGCRSRHRRRWTDADLDAQCVPADQSRLTAGVQPGRPNTWCRLAAQSRCLAHVAGDVGHLVVGDPQRVVGV